MKHNAARWGMAVLTVTLGVGLGSGLLLRQSAMQPSMSANDFADTVSVPPPTAKPRYLLKGYEGKLAVFLIGKKEPELILERYLHHLPDVDRMRLENGIEIEQYAELVRLIEDYTS